MVICSIAIAVLVNGHPNNLNLLDIRGTVVKQRGDYLVVNFGPSLPDKYQYLQGPAIEVPENACLYVD